MSLFCGGRSPRKVGEFEAMETASIASDAVRAQTTPKPPDELNQSLYPPSTDEPTMRRPGASPASLTFSESDGLGTLGLELTVRTASSRL